MSIKKLVVTSVLAIYLLSGGAVLAQPKAESKECSKQYKKCKFLKKLTDVQRSQVKEIMQSYRSEFKLLRKQMHDLNKQLKAQYDSGKPSWEVIKPLMDKLNQLKSHKSILRAKMKLEIFKKIGVKLPPKKYHRPMMKQDKMK